MELLLQILLLIAGFVLLVKGADWFVDGASGIASRLGIPELVVGLTIVAMGTSLPEAAVSIVAAIKGSAEITIGNVVGSNILNVLIILGITSLIREIAVQRSTVRYELPFTIGVTVLLVCLGLLDHYISRADGWILWIFMILYLLYLWQMTKKGSQEEAKEERQKPIWLLLLMVASGGTMIVFGSDITVDAATAMAKMFGMSERFIGLTIVALGTSLPELVTSVTAAIKGKSDIAMGNIVGSNIFNILFVVGTTALITPVEYAASFTVDSIVAIVTMLLLLLCVARHHKLGRLGGTLLLLSYGGYFVYLMQS
ncbi:MAG: calcium/sodium antiporter [Lachnospiraceae bacterium]|nr:calcium/sodium antiporter [Lachnospiraceae bacterium]